MLLDKITEVDSNYEFNCSFRTNRDLNPIDHRNNQDCYNLDSDNIRMITEIFNGKPKELDIVTKYFKNEMSEIDADEALYGDLYYYLRRLRKVQ